MLVSHGLLIITNFLNIFVLPYFITDIVLQVYYWEWLPAMATLVAATMRWNTERNS